MKLAEEILFTKLPDAIPNLKRGREHESDAFTEYLEICSMVEQEAVRKAKVSPAFLGQAQTALLENLKIIEIKCPYSVRDMTVKEACNDKRFYCTLQDDMLHLNQEYVYYYQVQGNMAVIGANMCDFVVWTPKSMMVEITIYSVMVY